jgi:hypothetical protein
VRPRESARFVTRVEAIQHPLALRVVAIGRPSLW